MAAARQDLPDLEAGSASKEDRPAPPAALAGTGPIGEKYQKMLLNIDSWMDKESVKKLKQAKSKAFAHSLYRSTTHDYDQIALIQNMDWSFMEKYGSELGISPPLLWDHLLHAQYPYDLGHVLHPSNQPKVLPSVVADFRPHFPDRDEWNTWWHIRGTQGDAAMQFEPSVSIGGVIVFELEPEPENHTLITFYSRGGPGQRSNQECTRVKLGGKGSELYVARNNFLVLINAAHLPRLSVISRSIAEIQRLWWSFASASGRLLFRNLSFKGTADGSTREEQSNQGEPMLEARIGDFQAGLDKFLQSWMSEYRIIDLLDHVRRAHGSRSDYRSRWTAQKGCCLMMNRHVWEVVLPNLEDEVEYLGRAAVRNPDFDAFTRINTARDMVARFQTQILQEVENARKCETALRFALNAVRRGETNDQMRMTETDRTRKVVTWMNEYDTLCARLDELEPKLEKAFGKLISAITVLDSAEAKKQGKRTTLLTIVAAFYLPLSLAVGVFGMNVKGLDGVDWWWPVIVSAILGIPSIVVIIVALVR